MVQDLDGKKLDNQYYDRTPRQKDWILAVSSVGLYMKQVGGEIAYPKYNEVLDQLEKAAVPDGENNDTHSFRYLFDIDDEWFFLTMDKEIIDLLEANGYEAKQIHWMRGMFPRYLSYAGTLGLQLADWYRTRCFCGCCGKKMVHLPKERAMQCTDCGTTEFPKLCPCVIVGVIHDGKILVSQYKGGFTSHYALIAGFAEFGETIEECVKREVYEETHLKVDNLRYYKSQPWPFSSSLLFGFFCELSGKDHIVIQEDELAMAKWVTPEEIFEEFRDDALTNEMLILFQQYGDELLTMDEIPDIRSRFQKIKSDQNTER